MINTLKFKPLNPKRVLAVAAHADDIDFCMSGTVAKWADEGAEIYYLILTNGDRGTADMTLKRKELIRTRQHEQRVAAQVLGVKDVYFCDYEDCCLKCDKHVTRDVVKYIRLLKPDTVLTMDPSMLYSPEWGYINHPDHRAAGQATLDAVYPLARDHLSFPELLKRYKLEPHKVQTLLLLNFQTHNYDVDISQYIDNKQAAMASHASQISDAHAVRRIIHDQAAAFGKQAGVKYAEPYIRIDISI